MTMLPFFSVGELIDTVIMSLAFGFIFKDFFSRKDIYDTYIDIPYYKKGFDWRGFWYSSMIVTPAVFFHEMGHKFMAIALGYNAVFHAPYTWLAIAVVLKLLHSPIIFLVGGYVSAPANISNLSRMLISFAGPFINLVFGISILFILKSKTLSKKIMKYRYSLAVFMKLNMFLFIFNMLPIPGFDGFTFFSSLFRIIF